MTGKRPSTRVGEARVIPPSHYVFSAGTPVALANGGLYVGTDGNRLLYWPTAAPVSGEATYLFYMGYIRLIHFAAAMIYRVTAGRIYWACNGNRYSRAVYRPGLASQSWCKALSVVR